MGKDMTNLFHFEGGFDLGNMLFHISLQRWNVNWLANGACHVEKCSTYKIFQERAKWNTFV